MMSAARVNASCRDGRRCRAACGERRRRPAVPRRRMLDGVGDLRRRGPAQPGVSRSSAVRPCGERTTVDASVPYQPASDRSTSRSSSSANLAQRLDQSAFDVGDAGMRQRRARRPRAAARAGRSSWQTASTACSAARRAVVYFTPTSEMHARRALAGVRDHRAPAADRRARRARPPASARSARGGCPRASHSVCGNAVLASARQRIDRVERSALLPSVRRRATGTCRRARSPATAPAVSIRPDDRRRGRRDVARRAIEQHVHRAEQRRCARHAERRASSPAGRCRQRAA